MNTTHSSLSHWGLLRWMTAGAVALLLSATSSAFAQQTGTVSGQVVDGATGKYLEGAEVIINGTDLHTTTERDGKFALHNVPEGAQKVTVNYPGMDASESSLAVTAGQTVDIPVKMVSGEVVMLGAFKIEGTKEGMAQAVALQKVSIESKLIAANDQFGSISEGNIGEYLKFLPGVGIVYNSNDARGIALRGLRSQFTTVAIDGTPMASASSSTDSRRFETEQVSANNVETTQIIKTITPDMPANSTGGYINMITKSAFDRQDAQRLDYKFYLTAPSSRLNSSRSATFNPQTGTWGNDAHYVIRPNLNLNFAKRVNDKLGFNINYSLSEIYNDSPRTEYTWFINNTSTIKALGLTPTPVTIAGNSYQSYGNVNTVDDPTLQTYNMNNEQKLTHREALASKIDYNISDSTKLTFSGQWNWYDLTFFQRATTFNFGTTAATLVNLVGTNLNASNTAAATVPAGGTAGTSNTRSIQVNDNQREKFVTGVHFNTTLTHDFSDNSKAWLVGYWSQADGKYRDATKGYMAQGVAQYTGGTVGGSIPVFTVDNVLSSPEHPSVLINGGATPLTNLFDLNNYALLGGANMRTRPESALDTKDGFQGNYKYSFNTTIPISVQTGAAYDVAGRTIRRQQFNATNPAYTSPITAGVSSDYLFDYGYNFGTGKVLDPYRLYNAYASTLVLNADNYRRFDENNKAGYLRADATFFKDLLLVGGVRWEKREITGSAVNAASATSRILPASLAYDNWYPSATFRYTPNRKWVIRGGYSRTVGDPDYAEILPTFTQASITGPAGSNDAVFSMPSKSLKPYYVNNYDVSVEYYFSKSGVIGGSLFRKEVSGFIVSKTVALTDPLVVQTLQDYGVTADQLGSTPTATIRTNGASSKIQGIELWYNQNLTFLPKPFDGLNLQLNFTKVNIGANDLDTLYAQTADAVTKSINARLSYRWRQLQVAVTTNWTDEVLIQQSNLGTAVNSVVITNPDGSKTTYGLLNQYKAPEIKTKFEMSYAFSTHYVATFEVDNIGYRRQEYLKNYQPLDQKYQLPGRYFQYGDPVVRVGVKGTF